MNCFPELLFHPVYLHILRIRGVSTPCKLNFQAFHLLSGADYFKSQQRKVDINTIYNYLNALDSAFVIQRISRYDIKGKEILQTNEKEEAIGLYLDLLDGLKL